MRRGEGDVLRKMEYRERDLLKKEHQDRERSEMYTFELRKEDLRRRVDRKVFNAQLEYKNHSSNMRHVSSKILSEIEAHETCIKDILLSASVAGR